MRKLLTTAALLAAPLLCTACPASDSTAPGTGSGANGTQATAAQAAIEGQYNLQAVSGAATPTGVGSYVIGGLTCDRFIDGGFLNLGAGFNFQLSVSYRIVCPPTTTTGVQYTTGTWSYDGTTLGLTRTSGSVIGISTPSIGGGLFTANLQLETNPPGAPTAYPLLLMKFQK